MLVPLNNKQSALNGLIRQFYKGSHNIKLEVKDVNELTWSHQEEFIKETVNNYLTKKYPISNEFIKAFIKKLIGYLELVQDVHDDLYKYLCMTMKNTTIESYYHHYLIGNNVMNRIIIRETNNLVLNGTTGMRTWEAALMLVDWALCNKEVFRNKYVLELGSGVGFTGVAIAKFCPLDTILMSDFHYDVLNMAEQNINVNFPCSQSQTTTYAKMFTTAETKVNIGVMNLDWTDISDLSEELCPDIIIGADIVYDPTILKPLCEVFEWFFKKNKNIVIIIAGIIRNEDTFEQFSRMIETNFQVEYIQYDKNVFIEWNQDIKKYLLKIKL
ncbi:unnamed protein product [Chilo suppressalis]|uniref:FAM86 N-terminal domain-containing protein n=1 Tax=Chilo suppressalis TaxID=168631 RepID=A0ABN8B9N2_CHISP|nr:hypothetical protein evm_007373 [Chilo suppressalis]CAH0406401.1 unnamed protein product [Chilo suppressalis]